MNEQQETRLNFSEILKSLTKIMVQAESDGGKTYDQMAVNIRKRAADGLIEEAIGYVPPDVESVSTEDAFRPMKRRTKGGELQSNKRFSRPLKNNLTEEHRG